MQPRFLSLLYPTVSLLSGLTVSVQVYSETEAEPDSTLPVVEVSASADASADGLSSPYAGGQVAEGGKIGILGTQSNMDSPFSVTSYTNEYIKDKQADNIGDVLKTDPSVRVARGFGNFQQVYIVRGLPIYSDDIGYNGLYGLLPRQYLATEFVERVEVLRGANAFLNGAAPGGSGLGGAVNIVPKRAGNEDLTQVSLGVEYGTQAYLSTDLSRRSDDGRFGVRVNASQHDGDTAVDGESAELGMAAIGADYRGESLRVSADFGYQNHKLKRSQPSINIGTGLPIPVTPVASNSIAQPWNYSNEKDVFGTLRAEYDFNDHLTAWVAAGIRDGDESGFFSNPTTINTNGDSTATGFQNVREDAIQTGETGLRVKFKTGSVDHRATLSANVYSSESKNAYGFSAFSSIIGNIYNPFPSATPDTTFFTGGDMSNPLLTAKTKTASIAIADEMAFMQERLLLTVGARNQTIEDYAFNYDTGAETDRYDESKTTPIAGVVYKINPKVSAYLNYIEGLVKGEEAPDTTSSGAPVGNAGAILEPYSTEQIELGLKFDSGNIGGAVSLFESRKPISGLDANNVFVELDNQVNRGLEISFYGEAQPGLRVLGGASFLDADVDGKKAIGAPNTQANLGLEWDINAVYGLTLEGDLSFTSAQYADDANTQKVPDWSTLGLGARYVMDLWDDQLLTLRGRLENVTDENYWASAGGFPGAGYLTIGAPRSLSISATIDF